MYILYINSIMDKIMFEYLNRAERKNLIAYPIKNYR